MSTPKKPEKTFFPKVKEAREALAAEAIDLFKSYMRFIQEAHAAEQWEVAQEGYQFLFKHMPKSPEGEGMIDSNVDKDIAGKRQIEGPKGPTIQIGIALSPREPKALPPVEVIDVTED